MKKNKLSLFALLTFVLGSIISVLPPQHAAAFNPSRIIDDSVFNNVGTMNASQIDTFLNTLPSSCISTNRGFSAPDPTGYSPSGGFVYGGLVSGGTVIAHAAQAYDLNPQV